MQLTIDVTAEDIRLGSPQHSCKCPIARAFKRATGETVQVGNGSVSKQTKSGYLRTHLPWEARQFITLFDVGREVEPITFEVEWSEDET